MLDDSSSNHHNRSTCNLQLAQLANLTGSRHDEQLSNNRVMESNDEINGGITSTDGRHK